MGLDLTNPYEGIKAHVAHDIVCVAYAGGDNVAIECETCGVVLIDADNEDRAVAHVDAIVQTVTGMIEAGEIAPDDIDWDLVIARHGARLLSIMNENSDDILRRVWEEANGHD